MADIALRHNLVFELTSMIDSSIELKQYNDLQIFTSTLLKDPDLYNVYHDSLFKAYRTFAVPLIKASLAFNLANYYQRFCRH